MSATVATYTGLITSEHADEPNFVAMVSVDTSVQVDGINLLNREFLDFDVDLAIGVQLDTLGLFVGVGRVITVQPSDAYPAAAAYQVTLGDEEFRRLIKARALANEWDGTPEGAAAILAAWFGPIGAYGFIIDNQDMSITLGIAGTAPTAAQAAVFSQFYLPIRAAGVRVKDSYVPPVIGALFGLDVATVFVNGVDYGAFGSAF